MATPKGGRCRALHLRAYCLLTLNVSEILQEGFEVPQEAEEGDLVAAEEETF